MEFDYSNPPQMIGDGTNAAGWLRANNFPYEIEEAKLWRLWMADVPDEDLLYDDEYRSSLVFAPSKWEGSYWIHDGMSQVVVEVSIDEDISEDPNGHEVMEKALYDWAERFNSSTEMLFGIIEARPSGDGVGQEPTIEPGTAVIFLDVHSRPMEAAVKLFKKSEKYEAPSD